MADDILDAAQKAINDAAAGVISGSTPPADVPPVVPSEPPAAPMKTEPEPSTIPPEPPPAPPVPEPATSAPEPVIPPAPPMPEPIVPAPSPVTPPAPEQPTATPAAPEQTAATPAQSGEQIMSDLLGAPTVPGVPVVPPVKHDKPSGPLPKKKSGKGGIIAVIAALLLTLPVAVYYLSQQDQQIADIRNRATGTGAYASECDNDPSTSIPSCPAGYVCHALGGDAATGTKCEPNSFKQSCINQGRSWCTNMYGFSDTCCVAGYICNPSGPGCVPGGSKPTATPGGGTTTPVCQNIKIYKGGTQVTPSALKAGDAIVLAVKGNLSPAKAHFRVNGGAWSETTTKNGSGEFTLNYTVPEGITQFVIEGEVFTDGAWY